MSERSMRRPVVAVMSGVSLLVVGASLKSSQKPAAPVALGSASVVAPGATASQLPSPVPSATAAPRARASGRPTPTSTRLVRRTASPTAAATARRTARAAPAVTVNGAAYDTRYGPVQVQITVRSRRITAADAVQYPQSGGRDQEINSYAVPQLDHETLDAQSAQIDTVSGATYTSDGYRESLQSAIDAAHKAGAL